VKLNEGLLLGSKATVGVEAGELKLNPPVDVDVDDCNITTNINLFGEKKNIYIYIYIDFDSIFYENIFNNIKYIQIIHIHIFTIPPKLKPPDVAATGAVDPKLNPVLDEGVDENDDVA